MKYIIGFTNVPIVKHKYKVMLINVKDLSNAAEFFMFDKDERDRLIDELKTKFEIDRMMEFVY